MVIVGIDIAKRSHNATIINSDGDVLLRSFSFKNDMNGFNRLLTHIEAYSPKEKKVVVGMESSSHYWVALHDQFVKRDYQVFVLNPIQSSALRNLNIRKNKSDPVDSLLIADTVRYGRFSPSNILESDLLSLRELTRQRFYLVDVASDLKRKIRALVDQVFPKYETLFSAFFCKSSCQLLLKYPTPSMINRVQLRTIEKTISKPSKYRFGLEKAKEIKQLAKNSFGSTTIEDSIGFIIQLQMKQLLEIQEKVDLLDEEIEVLFCLLESPITSVPGVGQILGAIIVSEIGDISRFRNASKLAAYAGMDPSVNQSGEYNSRNNRMSKRGSPYLRRALWLAASSAIHSDPALRNFYDRKRKAGKSHMTTLGHVSRKLLSIIFAILRDNKMYEPHIV